MFYALRAWSHGAEIAFKMIEDDFQELANNIIKRITVDIVDQDALVADRFFALWHTRARRRELLVQQLYLANFSGSERPPTPDQMEMMEKMDIGFVAPGGKVLAREINGDQIIMTVNHMTKHLKTETKWGIINADSGEFVVPAIPLYQVIPLTPSLSLVSPSLNGSISKINVAEINRKVIDASGDYFFLRYCAACPVLAGV